MRQPRAEKALSFEWSPDIVCADVRARFRKRLGAGRCSLTSPQVWALTRHAEAHARGQLGFSAAFRVRHKMRTASTIAKPVGRKGRQPEAGDSGSGEQASRSLCPSSEMLPTHDLRAKSRCITIDAIKRIRMPSWSANEQGEKSASSRNARLARSYSSTTASSRCRLFSAARHNAPRRRFFSVLL